MFLSSVPNFRGVVSEKESSFVRSKGLSDAKLGMTESDFHRGGHFIRAVIHQDDLSLGWSFIRLDFHHGGLLSGWTFMRMIFYQVGLS